MGAEAQRRASFAANQHEAFREFGCDVAHGPERADVLAARNIFVETPDIVSFGGDVERIDGGLAPDQLQNRAFDVSKAAAHGS